MCKRSELSLLLSLNIRASTYIPNQTAKVALHCQITDNQSNMKKSTIAIAAVALLAACKKRQLNYHYADTYSHPNYKDIYL